MQQETGAQVIITGVNPPSEDLETQFIGNMYLDGSKTFYRAIPYNGKSYSGTGDLFASVIMGSMMRGERPGKICTAGDGVSERIDP